MILSIDDESNCRSTKNECELVSDQWCKLNDLGITALRELLALLDLEPVASRVKEKLKIAGTKNLDRIRTITPILNNQPVQEKGLTEFFVRMIKQAELEHRHNHQNGVIDDHNLRAKLNRKHILTNYSLREYFISCHQNNFDERGCWNISPDLYQEVASPLDSQATRSSNKNTRRDDIVKLLCHLDYSDQEDDFQEQLKTSTRCVPFLINTPCPTTQKWALNRLIKRATHCQANPKIIHIDLVTNNVRDNYGEFIKLLSPHFNAEPDQIVKEIDGCNFLVILIIYKIEQFENVQREIYSKLIEHLNQNLAGAERPKIIVFYVGSWHRDYAPEGLVNLCKLAKLEEINQGDINRWLDNYEYFHPFLGVLRSEQLGDSNGNWTDPWLILDNICTQLGVNGGIEEIKTLWEWTS